MKKLLTVLIVAIFVLALSACSSTNSGNTDSQENSSTTTQSQTTENNTSSADDQQTQGTTQSSPNLTADEALDIALNQAGVTRESIRNLENRLDRENGVLVYEIDFESGNTEYSYDINAETGAVVERDSDIDD